MSVLRAKGFDGATMNDLSEATGLKKASLYHRFPGGKKEIVEAVLNYTGEWGQTHIYQVLVDDSRTPEQRIALVLDNIRDLYHGGKSICILRALTMDSSLPFFGELIENSFRLWLSAFKQLGIDKGFTEDKAERLALDNLIRIQGSLVLSKALDTVAPFQQSLLEIEKHYMT